VQFPPKGSFDEVIMSFIVDFPLFFFFCSDWTLTGGFVRYSLHFHQREHLFCCLILVCELTHSKILQLFSQLQFFHLNGNLSLGNISSPGIVQNTVLLRLRINIKWTISTTGCLNIIWR
jgi:hypothetical protein